MGSDPWTPSKAPPWESYSTPRPQLARAMTFACRHDIIKNPTNFLVVVVWGGGQMKFLQIERGDQQFFCCFQGGIKNLTESFIPLLPHPPWAKNDNSLIYRREGNLSESPNHFKYGKNILISRFYEQFSRSSRILGHFWKYEKISNS